MPETRRILSRTLLLLLIPLMGLSLTAACELKEPRRPNFLPTAAPTTPTPVYPFDPVDAGVNAGLCEALGDGLSRVPKSSLRYGAVITFKRGMTQLESAHRQIDESNDAELSASLKRLMSGIERDDAQDAAEGADASVRRCKELGYRIYMTPFGYAVW